MKIQTFLYFIKQKPARQLELCCTGFLAEVWSYSKKKFLPLEFLKKGNYTLDNREN